MDKWLKTYINKTILNSHLLDWWKTWGYCCWEEWWRRRKWKYKGGLITESLEKYFSLERDFIREGWWWWKLTCTAFHLRPLEIACLHLIFLRCVYAKARRRLQLSKDPLLEAGPVLYIMLLVTLQRQLLSLFPSCPVFSSLPSSYSCTGGLCPSCTPGDCPLDLPCPEVLPSTSLQSKPMFNSSGEGKALRSCPVPF